MGPSAAVATARRSRLALHPIGRAPGSPAVVVDGRDGLGQLLPVDPLLHLREALAEALGCRALSYHTSAAAIKRSVPPRTPRQRRYVSSSSFGTSTSQSGSQRTRAWKSSWSFAMEQGLLQRRRLETSGRRNTSRTRSGWRGPTEWRRWPGTRRRPSPLGVSRRRLPRPRRRPRGPGSRGPRTARPAGG